ncbi:nuclease harbi1 [Elysia marginata]|uniref:Nuclease harbi1 n=1 Tax=Elysia marginata TaxID=1093978 RepID=A0AAV4G5H1_9GAST|nr:nuclease harbi1 [Elysia marginata]
MAPSRRNGFKMAPSRANVSRWALKTTLIDELGQSTRKIRYLMPLMSDNAAFILQLINDQHQKIARDTSAHIDNFVEESVPRYTIIQFQEHFRMTQTTFEELRKWLAPQLPIYREDTNSGKKVLATIWLISNRDAYRDVADCFGVSKGTLHRIVMMVCTALTNMRHDVINGHSIDR